MLSLSNLYQLRLIFPALAYTLSGPLTTCPAIFSDWKFEKKRGGKLLLTSRFQIDGKPFAKIELSPYSIYFYHDAEIARPMINYLTYYNNGKYDYTGWFPIDSDPFHYIYKESFIGIGKLVSFLPKNIEYDDLQRTIFDIFFEMCHISSFVHDSPAGFIWTNRNFLLRYREKYLNPVYEYIAFFLSRDFIDNGYESEIMVMGGKEADIDSLAEFYEYAITFANWKMDIKELSHNARSKRKQIREIVQGLKMPVDNPFPSFQFGAERKGEGKSRVLLGSWDTPLRFQVREIPADSVNADIEVEQEELPDWKVRFS